MVKWVIINPTYFTQPKMYLTRSIATPSYKLYGRFNNKNAIVKMQV